MDFKINIQENLLGDPLPKLLKPFRSVETDGQQSYKWKKKLSTSSPAKPVDGF